MFNNKMYHLFKWKVQVVKAESGCEEVGQTKQIDVSEAKQNDAVVQAKKKCHCMGWKTECAENRA